MFRAYRDAAPARVKLLSCLNTSTQSYFLYTGACPSGSRQKEALGFVNLSKGSGDVLLVEYAYSTGAMISVHQKSEVSFLQSKGSKKWGDVGYVSP